MSGQRHLPDQAVVYFEQQLAQHYGEPVRPVSAYCEAFEQWFDIIRTTALARAKDDPLRTLGEALNGVAFTLPLAIRKSSLLWRLIYGGEPLRTERCPTHWGVWSGLPSFGNDCECDLTGWLPQTNPFQGEQR